MKESKRLTIVGPFPPPITGMSLSNKVAARLAKRHGYSVVRLSTSFGEGLSPTGGVKNLIRSIVSTLRVLCRAVAARLRSRLFYVTPAQSVPGILRWLPLYLLVRATHGHLVFHFHGNYIYEEYSSGSSTAAMIACLLLRLALFQSR